MTCTCKPYHHIECAMYGEDNRPVTHLMIGSSTVRCGAKMLHWKTNPFGWTLGRAGVSHEGSSTNIAEVTCPSCLVPPKWSCEHKVGTYASKGDERCRSCNRVVHVGRRVS